MSNSYCLKHALSYWGSQCPSCVGEAFAAAVTPSVQDQEVPAPPKLGDCLDEAKATICGERQDQYGSPEDSFALVAKYWNTYLLEVQKKILVAAGFDLRDYKLVDLLETKDIAHMMILFKMARVQGQKPSRDSYVGICGYAAIAADKLTEK